MRLFPAISARKGADERKVGFSQKHRDAAEVHAELSGTAHSGTGYPWISLHACSNRRKFLSPQTPRRPLTPPPLFASNRSSKNIAELARLRSLRASPFRKSVRGVLQNRILMGAGDCGGRLRIRDTAKTVRELFSLFLQITDRPRKMRQYRLNRESILYIEGRRPANTPRGHRKSCRDEFETLPIPPPPAPQKNETSILVSRRLQVFFTGTFMQVLSRSF